MPPTRHSEDDYAAEAYDLDPEASPKSLSGQNGVRHHYHNDDGDLDNDYLAGEETEDDRAILLQEMNGSNGAHISTKSPEYDPSDDSAAAMVHRVRHVLARLLP